MSELAKSLGVDTDYLKQLPRGSAGVNWAPAWKSAIHTLYIAGIPPLMIVKELPDGPSKDSIYIWARDGKWDDERNEFQRKVTEKALAQVEETEVQVNARHLKALKAAEYSALSAIAQRSVQAKTLEGTISSLVMAIKAERQVRGMQDTPEVEVNNTQFNLTSLGVDLDMLDRLPPDQREKALELQRQRIEIQAQINALSAGGQIVEGHTNGQDHPAESGGDNFDSPMP